MNLFSELNTTKHIPSLLLSDIYRLVSDTMQNKSYLHWLA